MSEPFESFEKDLEQLIRLFKKIRTNTQNEQFAHLDKAFTQNLDFIINNYEMVKHNIPIGMLNQMGIPFHKMLQELIAQLKNELGEDIYDFENRYFGNSPETKSVAGEVEQKVDSSDIEKIDLMLKNPNLSEAELNSLLDARNDLIRNQKTNQLTGQ